MANALAGVAVPWNGQHGHSVPVFCRGCAQPASRIHGGDQCHRAAADGDPRMGHVPHPPVRVETRRRGGRTAWSRGTRPLRQHRHGGDGRPECLHPHTPARALPPHVRRVWWRHCQDLAHLRLASGFDCGHWRALWFAQNLECRAQHPWHPQTRHGAQQLHTHNGSGRADLHRARRWTIAHLRARHGVADGAALLPFLPLHQ